MSCFIVMTSLGSTWSSKGVQATAARSIAELKIEIETLKGLEKLALDVRHSGTDTKWRELASLLNEIFTTAASALARGAATTILKSADKIPPPKSSPHQKLVLFTEHRDTLNYLEARITTLLGRKEAVVVIHGNMGREDRVKAQESFRHDPDVRVLLATDAAGEGINLQRAHLMVNYDLPWNPNRLEQRFGRIHRIGQTEVCHLWNLVADETREGDVYRRLLEKLEEARERSAAMSLTCLANFNSRADHCASCSSISLSNATATCSSAAPCWWTTAMPARGRACCSTSSTQSRTQA